LLVRTSTSAFYFGSEEYFYSKSTDHIHFLYLVLILENAHLIYSNENKLKTVFRRSMFSHSRTVFSSEDQKRANLK